MSDAQAAPVTENGVPSSAQGQLEEAPGFKVFVGNLAYVTKEDGLKDFFAPFESDISSTQIILRGTRSAGYGFVAFSSADAAQNAVETLHKKDLDGRPIIVELAKLKEQKDMEKKEKKAKRRPGRRGAKAIPGELSEAEADGEAVARSDGEAGPETEGAPVSDETLKPKKKKSPRKNKTQKAPDGEATAVAQGAETEGTETKRVVRRKPKTPRPTRAPGEDPIGEPSKTMLFVANLGFNVDDDGLAAVFTDAGIHVTSARIVRRRWGQPRKSKGYGFVDVGSEDEQKRAMDVLQDMDVGGRVIAVRIAVDTQRDGDAGEGPANEGPSATA